MQRNIDFITKASIENTIIELDQLLKLHVFTDRNVNIYLNKSVFTHIMILLRDLLSKAEKYGKGRVSFTDSIEPFGKVKDVTDLVSYIRNAVCHIDSENHMVDTNKISFCFIKGKGGLAKIDDLELYSEYEDDICFFFGRSKIYLVRHIYRAFREAVLSLGMYNIIKK